MSDLVAKIEQLKKTLAAMKPKGANNLLVPAIKMPAVKPLSMPPVSSSSKAAAQLPGISPASSKDPRKAAEQLKNPRPKKSKVEVLKVEKNGQWELEKAIPDFKVPKAISFDRPHVDTSNPNKIHADYHGFGGSMNTVTGNQKNLIHGLDMSTGKNVAKDTATKGNRWMHNPVSDKHMIVKPASGAEFGDPKTQKFLGHDALDGLNAARREVLSHNLAHNIGLGAHFPNTAGFTHRGEDYSAQERVAGPELRDIRSHKTGNHPLTQHYKNTLKHLHRTGDLHKLAVFDALMGNNDRHFGNAILDPKKKIIHHIDNGRAIDYSKARQVEPSRLLTAANEHGLPSALHPKAREWLNNLDEKSVAEHLGKYVEPDSRFKSRFLNRLHNLKTILNNNPKMSLQGAIESLGVVGSKKRVDLKMFASPRPAVNETTQRAEVSQLGKADIGSEHYRIHVDGHPVTEPMPLKHIVARHGSIKQIESVPGTRVIPLKMPPPLPKVAKNGQWELDKFGEGNSV
jgi:hypothetical protein